jgi:hypothetical protein
MAPIAAKYWQIFKASEYYETLKKRYSSWAFAMPTRGRPSGLEDGSGILGCNGEGGSSPLLLSTDNDEARQGVRRTDVMELMRSAPAPALEAFSGDAPLL